MSREAASGYGRRPRTPSRARGSRARAGDTALSTGIALVGARALLVLGPLFLLAVALLPRMGGQHASASSRGIWRGSGGHAASAVQAIDPRLVLTPRTLTQTAMAGGVQVTLTAGPLLPGANIFALRLVDRGHALTGAHVLLTARMIGMAMRPVMLPMRAVGSGRYAGTGPLSMFGPWQVTARIERPGAATLSRQFSIGLDLPTGFLTATRNGAPQQ